ncbi:MAG: OmpA family protein, partial [Bacteroidetes bacterium]
MRYFSLLAIITLLPLSLSAQQDEPIELFNPSFEDFPRYGNPPRGWYDCGFPGETPPDVQPLPDGQFQVSKPAKDGNTYLGIVVRDNDTWEMVAQRLSRPLEKGKCYVFSLQLARSEVYRSQSRTTNELVNYTTPCKLRIWGGSNYCQKVELLAESQTVINTTWKEYNFRFEPKQTHQYIMLEAFYDTPVLFPYNGNILVDKASPILPVPCAGELPPEEPTEIAVEEEPAPPPPPPSPT